MGSGVASTCVEVLWRILGFLFSLSFPFLFCFSFISWNRLVFFTCHKSYVCQSQNSSSLLFFCFFLSKSFFSCSISSSGKHLSCFSLHGLGPKGGIGVLAYIQPTTSPPVLPSTIMGTHPLPPPCMCSMGFCPCLRFCPHQSRVSSPPKLPSSPSVVHDHTFAAIWGVVGGCCFYEGKKAIG